jgi:hypothetical protein
LRREDGVVRIGRRRWIDDGAELRRRPIHVLSSELALQKLLGEAGVAVRSQKVQCCSALSPRISRCGVRCIRIARRADYWI